MKADSPETLAEAGSLMEAALSKREGNPKDALHQVCLDLARALGHVRRAVAAGYIEIECEECKQRERATTEGTEITER